MNWREAIIWLLAALWFAANLVGVWAWEHYEATPGSVGEAKVEAGAVGRWQLTVYAHPRCPCTKATIAELKVIAASAQDLEVRVRIVRPTGSPEGWERGSTWDAASQIPRCEVAADGGGIEARGHGAETSGHAVLIDPAGRVTFRGGLTIGRGRTVHGHPVLAILAGADSPSAPTPVYGCPLFTPDE